MAAVMSYVRSVRIPWKIAGLAIALLLLLGVLAVQAFLVVDLRKEVAHQDELIRGQAAEIQELSGRVSDFQDGLSDLDDRLDETQSELTSFQGEVSEYADAVNQAFGQYGQALDRIRNEPAYLSCSEDPGSDFGWYESFTCTG